MNCQNEGHKDRLREKQYVLGVGVNHMHIFLQSYIKTCEKFQKCQHKTVRGVAFTRYLIHMHFNSVRVIIQNLSYKCQNK